MNHAGAGSATQATVAAGCGAAGPLVKALSRLGGGTSAVRFMNSDMAGANLNVA
jgi:hypothetical protein